jgi:tmRNA-binding protein
VLFPYKHATKIATGHPISKFNSIKSRVTEGLFQKCGKQEYDKRETLKTKDQQREMDRGRK